MTEKTEAEARHMIDALREMLVRHSEAVDGRDRRDLHALAASMLALLEWLDGRHSAGMTPGEVFGVVEAVATAGCVALQTLGGRLARNEGWGGPFDEPAAQN